MGMIVELLMGLIVLYCILSFQLGRRTALLPIPIYPPTRILSSLFSRLIRDLQGPISMTQAILHDGPTSMRTHIVQEVSYQQTL